MYFIFTLLMFAGALVFQTSVLQIAAIREVKPDLILLIVVYLGLVKGPEIGCVSGFFFGLGADLCSHQINLGSNALTKTLIGFFCGISGKRLYTHSLFSQFLCVGASTLVDVGLSWRINGVATNWKQLIFYEMLYNLICCPLLVLIFRQGEKRWGVKTAPSKF